VGVETTTPTDRAATARAFSVGRIVPRGDTQGLEDAKSRPLVSGIFVNLPLAVKRDTAQPNCHFSDNTYFHIDSLQRFLSTGVVQRVTIEMPLQAYDGFIEQCEENSREFAVLKNGLIFRRKKEDHFERLIKIECTLEDAEKLLLLAIKTRPDIVADIARGITTALKSD
jgi:hypothetical protein